MSVVRGKPEIPDDSLIGKLTAKVQAARDEFGYGTVTVTVTEAGTARTYRMREDWWDVADRAAVRFSRVSEGVKK